MLEMIFDADYDRLAQAVVGCSDVKISLTGWTQPPQAGNVFVRAMLIQLARNEDEADEVIYDGLIELRRLRAALQRAMLPPADNVES